MQLHLNTDDKINIVTAFEPGKIRIGQDQHQTSIIVTSERVRNWPPQSIEELAEHHFQTLSEEDPEVVILGTGRQLLFPAAKLSRSLVERGIGLEIMDTAAACRTYNILAVDGRRVLAALLL